MIDTSKAHYLVYAGSVGGMGENEQLPSEILEFLCQLSEERKKFMLQSRWETDYLPKCENCKILKEGWKKGKEMRCEKCEGHRIQSVIFKSNIKMFQCNDCGFRWSDKIVEPERDKRIAKDHKIETNPDGTWVISIDTVTKLMDCINDMCHMEGWK